MDLLRFSHLLLGALLLGVTFLDAFVLRSPAAALLPAVANGTPASPAEDYLRRARTKAAVAEMILVILMLILGLVMWIPRMASYPAQIFHTKLLFAIIYLVLGKVRMLRERKRGRADVPLTMALAVSVLVTFCLGAYYILGGI